MASGRAPNANPNPNPYPNYRHLQVAPVDLLLLDGGQRLSPRASGAARRFLREPPVAREAGIHYHPVLVRVRVRVRARVRVRVKGEWWAVSGER